MLFEPPPLPSFRHVAQHHPLSRPTRALPGLFYLATGTLLGAAVVITAAITALLRG